MSLLKEESLLQTCSNSYVYVSIPEDQTPPSVLTTLTCTDADSGASGTLTYSIVSGNAAGAFDVQNNGGNCDVRLVTGGIIDFDTTSNSAFQVNKISWYLLLKLKLFQIMHVRLMMIFFYFTRCIFSKARDKSDHQWFFVLLNYLTNLHLSQTCSLYMIITNL